jgi:peptide deformylase
MAVRSIYVEGAPVLRKKSKVVARIDQRTIQLLDDMLETLAEADGVGLAAPQVGILKRIVVISTGDETVELINPEITDAAGEQEYLEGCLSCPGVYGNTGRPASLTVRAVNRKGEPVSYRAEGQLAVACCHEVDHLDGVLFLDKLKGPLYTAAQVAEMRREEEEKAEKAEKVETAEKTETVGKE